MKPIVVENGVREVNVRLGRGETASLVAFVLAGEGSAEAKIAVNLAGEGAEFELAALNVATGRGRAAVEVTVRHLAPGCVSRQLVKGIAAGEGVSSFAGLVHVAPGAQKSDAEQRSQGLQLSHGARIEARPELEIYADDVKCSHGATVGRLDEEAIYYMRQRGIGEDEARQLQLEGFAGEIISRCESEDYEKISRRVRELLWGENSI